MISWVLKPPAEQALGGIANCSEERMLNLQHIIKASVLCLAAMLCGAAVEAQEKRVAILEPEGNVGVTPMNKKLVRGVVREIVVSTKVYESVARNDASIDAMMKEHKFQRSELSDSNTAKRLGEMLGADLICSIEIHTENDEILIDCDIVDVQTGKNLNAGIVHLERYSNAAIKAALEPKIYQMLGIKNAPTQQVAVQPAVQGATLVAPQPVSASQTPPKLTGIAAKILEGEKRNLEFGPYKWRVLEVKGDRALLITEDVVEKRPYHSTGASVTWETCDLRYYLNGRFLEKFKTDEQRQIIETRIQTPNNASVSGGDDTMDKIFLLSIQEAGMYFGGTGKTSETWWLRSPVNSYGGHAIVLNDGRINTGGASTSVSFGLRPCLWLNLNPSLTLQSQAKPSTQPTAGITGKILAGEKRNLQFGPYEWLVLDVQGDRALMITQDVVENRPYHAILQDVTWETCHIRRYLNGDFLAKFKADEQKMIIETTIQNPNNDNTMGGNPTADKIFLLSIQEAGRYFAGDGIGKRWWLRSPGQFSHKASCVDSDGQIERWNWSSMITDMTGVRPALWLNLKP
jgi:sarcosine oxidase gamma subunit